jgi:hypothetical protein
MAGSRAFGRASTAGTGKGFVHNGANRAGATAALRAATEATVDLDGFPRARVGRDGIANLGVGKHVARTDDHGRFLGILELD